MQIGRTLGNCLSVANLARLAAVFGVPRVKRMLMLAEVLSTDEALECDFLLQVTAAGDIAAALVSLCERLDALAPVMQSVTKEGLRQDRHFLPVRAAVGQPRHVVVTGCIFCYRLGASQLQRICSR